MRILKKISKIGCIMLATTLMLGNMHLFLAAHEDDRYIPSPYGERAYLEDFGIPIPAPEHILLEAGITLAPEGIFHAYGEDYSQEGGRDTLEALTMVPAPEHILTEAAVASAWDNTQLTLEDNEYFEDFLNEAGIMFAPEWLLPNVADVSQSDLLQENILQEETLSFVQEGFTPVPVEGFVFYTGEIALEMDVTFAPEGLSPVLDLTITESEISLDIESGHLSEMETGDRDTIEMDTLATVASAITITYRGNGHTYNSAPGTQSFAVPSTITLAHPGNMGKTSHIFIGWRDAAGQIRPAGYNWTQNTAGSFTFDAVWQRITELYLNGNGHTDGNVPPVQRVAAPGTLVLPPPGTMVREGYTFVGWRCWTGGLAPVGMSWISYGGGFAFFAEWVPALANIEIRYRGNGSTMGNIPPTQRFAAPQTITLAQPGTMHKCGHMFVGWRDAAGNIRPAGHTWTQANGGIITFDAVWVAIMEVHLIGNGHTNGTPPPVIRQTVPNQVTLPPPGNMTKHGHMFVGWRCWSGAFHPVGTSWWQNDSGGFVYYAEWVPITMLYLIGNGHMHGIVPPVQIVAAPGTLTLPHPGTMTRPGYTFGGWRCWSGNLAQPGVSWVSYGGGFVFYAEWIPDASLPEEFEGFDIIAHLPTQRIHGNHFIFWPLEGNLLEMAKDSTYLILVFDTPPGAMAYLSWISDATFWNPISRLIPLHDTVFKIDLAQTLNQYARFVTTPCSRVFLELGGWHVPNMPMPTLAILSNGRTQ